MALRDMTAPMQTSDVALDGPSRAISEETARLCAERFGRALKAVVLTGSLARDEATVIPDAGGVRLLSDAEFLLVFDPLAALPSPAAVEALRRQVEAALAARYLRPCLTLSAAHPRYLQRLQPHIFAYELRTCGRVIWGDPGILSLIPAFSESQIPLEDAWRLLANRLVELLAEVTGPIEAGYRLVKLYLDMATSFLLFVGEYAPTYRARAARLRALADRTRPGPEWPFLLDAFATRVAHCTQLKLQGTAAWDTNVLAQEAVADARLLWRWELSRLTGASPDLPDHQLLDSWMRMQPFRQRARGWLYLLRQHGWRRGWSWYVRSMRRGWRASPRYWIYAASSDLLFAKHRPDGSPVLHAPGTAISTGWRRVVPVATNAGDPESPHAADGLAGAILSNYRQFLVDTRA